LSHATVPKAFFWVVLGFSFQAWVAALPEGCPCVLAVAGEAGAFDTLLTKLQEDGAAGCNT